MIFRKFCNAWIAALAVVTASSCNKEPIAQPQWFRSHTRYYYDLETDTSLAEAAMLLTATPQQPGDELFLYEQQKDTSIDTWYKVFAIFGSGFVTLRSDGIYSQASTSCNVGLGSTLFDYLTIPAHPARGAEVQLYGCERRDDGHNTVLTADTSITVPAGEFRVFCIKHPNGDISWWNRDIGIVMYRQRSFGVPFPSAMPRTAKLRRME